MSGVVLRCPNCGTTQAAEGQCDACHEASVRHFCRNHNPGVWLEGEACPQCGARFGDPEPARVEAAPVERPEFRPPPVRPAPYRPVDPGAGLGPWGTDAPTDPTSGGRAPGPDPFRILLGAMAAAARARSVRAERSGYEEFAPRRRRGGGCLGRILMLFLFLVALFVLGPIFLAAMFGFG